MKKTVILTGLVFLIFSAIDSRSQSAPSESASADSACKKSIVENDKYRRQVAELKKEVQSLEKQNEGLREDFKTCTEEMPRKVIQDSHPSDRAD